MRLRHDGRHAGGDARLQGLVVEVLEVGVLIEERLGLAARGVDVGKSLCEHDLVDTANAIFDATGVRLRQYPMTAPRVLAALREAGAQEVVAVAAVVRRSRPIRRHTT